MQEKTTQGKKSGGRKSKKKEEDEPKDPLPDTTGDYKVDVLGEAKAAEESGSEQKSNLPDDRRSMYPASMESLFTKEELEELRADIRAFVRREIKTAMVGAMKDLLTELSE